eukprot:GEMP01060060.1.p1 GENE.GEMP01060060.1~~GEMP01060060.1.p1  ORF type:complete len:430 (+),score=81.98 GEMP01060060.1:105-1394(+)
MAAPFSAITNALNRHRAATRPSSSKSLKARPKDPLEDPATVARLRAKFPDFDTHCDMIKTVDYKFECKNDARFAQKYHVPPTVDAHFKAQEHKKGIDAVRLTTKGWITAGHDAVKRWEDDKVVCERYFSAYDAVVAPKDEFAVLVGSSGFEIVDVASLMPKSKIKRDGLIQTCSIQTALSNKCATGDQHGTLNVHDVESGKLSYEWIHHTASISRIAWKDPNTLVCGGRNGKITIWDTRQKPLKGYRYMPSALGNAVSTRPCFEFEPHDGHPVFDIDLHQDTLFSCGGDNSLKKFDLRFNLWDHKETAKYLGHIMPIRALAVSPDRRLVTTCCEDGSARVFCVDELQYRRMNAKGSPDGKRELEHFLRDGYSSALLTLIGHTGFVTGAVWTSNSTLMTCSWDQSLQKFDLGDQISKLGSLRKSHTSVTL